MNLKTLNDTHAIRRTSYRRIRGRAWGISSLLMLATGFALQTVPAQAIEYGVSGPYDMRPFVSNTNPAFGCDAGKQTVSWKPVTVWAPSNMNVKVFVTNYTSSSTGGPFVNYPLSNSSPAE